MCANKFSELEYSATLVFQMARHAWCVLLLIGFQQAYALECYECRNVTDANTCNRTITCPANESCFMGASTLVSSERMYTLSCKDNSQCHAHSVSGPLIGRSLHSSYTKRDATCNECCSSKLCNKALCNHPRPTACVDDPSVDCAKMDSIFNVCADIHKAKLVCPRFCNLCNVVDGNWNWWSSWSGCDVTCGNGTQTRNRHCDDPVPQNGGLECVGNDTDRHTCNLVPCPIHGGWNQWSPWGSCSLTCDVGMQRRDRSCDNPYPSLGGDHCFGSSRDDKICYGPGCVDGNWSLWQPWTPCTATCDVGRRSKRRLCNNPFPSLMGHYCDGPNEETDTCYNIPCADGGWSLWQNWSTCTATCGGGLRTRERMCNNPVPSLLGRYCDGSSQMIDLCNKAPCTGSDIQFVVGQLAKANCYEKREGLWMCGISFGTFISRTNPHFDLQTARFTATQMGAYWFEWNIISAGSWATCFIKKNHSTVATIHLDDGQETSAGIRLQLMINDTVRFEQCALANADHSTPNLKDGSTFTGILIS